MLKLPANLPSPNPPNAKIAKCMPETNKCFKDK